MFKEQFYDEINVSDRCLGAWAISKILQTDYMLYVADRYILVW